MLVEKVNKNAVLTGALSPKVLANSVAPVMATPALVFTPATGKATAVVLATAVGYVTAKK
ncbi:hypothetical protein AB0D46_35860 [Streptomyces sp. NPDC048383]|uniref:hypothetical protein n=1 Tax=Streptomyces sp. NPDC048383 TaxID=3155386 RepID=UPI00343F3113